MASTNAKELESEDMELREVNLKKCNNSKQNPVEFDDLLTQAGEFGWYQMFLFVTTMPFYAYGVFSYYTQMFMTVVSKEHWCWIPELENLTAGERRTLAIPSDVNSKYGYDQCHSYSANWSQVFSSNVVNHSLPVVSCQNGWEFDSSEIPYPTITSEFGWVCDQSSYPATAQSVYFLGAAVGGIFVGWISDRYGRIAAIVASNVIGCLSGVLSAFATGFTDFTIYRFLMGMSYDNCMMMSYLLVLEYIAPKYRTMVANISFGLFYSLASVALPWIALACGNWKTLSLATSLPMGLALLAPFILPESPRWLLSKGRVIEAIDKVRTVSQVNKKVIASHLLQDFKDQNISEGNHESVSLLDLMKRPLLRRMFIITCVMYMCCTIVFDALVRSLHQLKADFFISFTVVSVTEFPSLLVVAFIMDWMGRRWLAASMMIIVAVICVLMAFITEALPSVICAGLARFFINMAFNTAIQWGAEVLPTSVRGAGVSVIHICGYISTMLSPYIVYLEHFVSGFTFIIVAMLSILGGVLALFLPETAMKEMPQTLDDSERLITSQKFWDMPFVRRLKVVDSFSGNINQAYEA